ncbi:MAG: hypothetical protein AABX98_06760, partial [Nanoarchaeota archaeon]
YLRTNSNHIIEAARKYYAPDNEMLREVLVSTVVSELSRVLGWKGKTNRYAFMEPQCYLNAVFTQFLQRDGYDGLTAVEGNDRTGALETKKGDSWVVFDPIKVRLVEEYRVVGEQQ